MKKIVLQALATLELIVRRLKTEKKDAIAAQLRNIIIEIQTVEPDEEIETWKRLYKNYIKLEDTIDSMMPTSRRNNSYCKSLKIDNIETRINGCRTVTQIANLYGSRYFKVNAQSYTKHNTVEFRQHSGTIEVEKIENWVRFLDGLVKYSEHEIIETGDFQSLNKFCNPELLNYLHTRIQSLNA